MSFDFDYPYLDASKLPRFKAIEAETVKKYGPYVLAAEMSNAQYGLRFSRLREANNMRTPPSHHRIFAGYLVVRRPGGASQYETWMPDYVFEELYVAGDKT